MYDYTHTSIRTHTHTSDCGCMPTSNKLCKAVPLTLPTENEDSANSCRLCTGMDEMGTARNAVRLPVEVVVRPLSVRQVDGQVVLKKFG